MVRPALAVVMTLVWIAGCTSAPSAAQPAVAPVLAPEDAPTAAPTTAPADVTTAVTTPVPTAVPTDIATDLPTVVPTAQPGGPAASGADTTAQIAADTSQLASCDGTTRPDPLPAPGSARAQDFFRSFRVPLPPAPLYDPPGPKRVGLQAGHWLIDQVPPELAGLQAGAVGGGKQEWQVNLDVAQRTASLLEASGIHADVLPATVPEHYQANAFVAIHSDGDTTGADNGFKVARPGFSSIPDIDDRLVDIINQVYGSETELPRDDEHISLRMRYYYAFNSRRYCHAVVPGVPQAIIELAYLTSAVDRQYLIGDPQRLAQALADSVQTFLATTP
jgi:N-acetylmuramoyl-L-alanine amidase